MEWNLEFPRKRHPSDDLVEEQPLSKRLSLLHLNGNDIIHHRKPKKFSKGHHHPVDTPLQPHRHVENRSAPVPLREERMDVDNVVYISDLDSESDEEEGRLIFLSDIEKQLTRVPYNLARKDKEEAERNRTSTELVLYSVPSSLSITEDKDSVRRAIIESRERARRKQAEELRVPASVEVLPETPVNGNGMFKLNGAPSELLVAGTEERIQVLPNQVVNGWATDGVPYTKPDDWGGIRNGGLDPQTSVFMNVQCNGWEGKQAYLRAGGFYDPSSAYVTSTPVNFDDQDAMEIE